MVLESPKSVLYYEIGTLNSGGTGEGCLLWSATGQQACVSPRRRELPSQKVFSSVADAVTLVAVRLVLGSFVGFAGMQGTDADTTGDSRHVVASLFSVFTGAHMAMLLPGVDDFRLSVHAAGVDDRVEEAGHQGLRDYSEEVF